MKKFLALLIALFAIDHLKAEGTYNSYEFIQALQYLEVIQDTEAEYLKLNKNKLYYERGRLRLSLIPTVSIEVPSVDFIENNFCLNREQFLAVCREILLIEQSGFFFCSKRVSAESDNSSKEIENLYSEATKHGIEFLGHSMAAGAAIEIPPLAIYEIYNATESLKSMADAYLKAKELEAQMEKDDYSSNGRSDWIDHPDNSGSRGGNDPFERHD